MAKGRKTGGRKKGVPNLATKDVREAVRLLYERQVDNLERWIVETGDGFEAVHFLADGTRCKYLERNPAKAAAIMAGLGEHFVPKLQRIEKGIPDASDEELLQEVRRRAAEAKKASGEG